VAKRANATKKVDYLWLRGRHYLLKKAESESASASMSRVWHSQTTIDPHPKLVNSAITL